MPKREFNGAIYFRCDAEMEATLREMQRHQKTVPVDLAKGLVDEACKFYRAHGYFNFPIVIGPKFQLMVAEPPSPEAGLPTKSPPITTADQAAKAIAKPDPDYPVRPRRRKRRAGSEK